MGEPVAWRYREARTGGGYSSFWRYFDDPGVVIPACHDGPYPLYADPPDVEGLMSALEKLEAEIPEGMTPNTRVDACDGEGNWRSGIAFATAEIRRALAAYEGGKNEWNGLTGRFTRCCSTSITARNC